MADISVESTVDQLQDLLAMARARGADAADILAYDGASVSCARRLGQPERIERSEGRDLGLRVFIGQRMAVVSSSDRDARALAELVERAVAMARAVPEDPYCGLAEPGQLARDWPALDLLDRYEPSAEVLDGWAEEAEATALAQAGISNSEGAEASWSAGEMMLVASNGFVGSYRSSGFGLSVSVVAEGEGGMETDHAYTSAVHREDLKTPAEIGQLAADRVLRRLGARKVSTTRAPVVYDSRVSASLLGHLSGAINGSAIARGTSFLKGRLGEQIFASGIEVVDDPHRPRGLRSKPFDGEGLANGRTAIIGDGRLKTWLLDLHSARQLGLPPTGHARRGTSSPPSPSATNLYMQPGKPSPEALISDIEEGFYVTSMMGSSVSLITGDYSRGASGFWIEGGEITYPVSEVTIAGNLKDMFLHLQPADDLEFRYAVNAPTIRIEGMTVAGK